MILNAPKGQSLLNYLDASVLNPLEMHFSRTQTSLRTGLSNSHTKSTNTAESSGLTSDDICAVFKPV